jgi:hypothetical protein
MSAQRGLAGVEAIRNLERDWDSYGANPPTVKALEIATMLISHPPWVVPCNDGGIQLEWHESGVDFEIVIQADGTQEYG